MIVFPLARSVGLKAEPYRQAPALSLCSACFSAALYIRQRVQETAALAIDLWTIADLDVEILRVVDCIVLVVVLGTVETLQRHDFSDDPRWNDLRSVELRDIGIRNSLLIIIDVKNGGSIRRTPVWALPVELRWIVGDGKEDAQQPVSDFGRIVNHFDDSACPVVSGGERAGPTQRSLISSA